MKKFINILLAAASLFAVSCQQKEEAYQWGEKDDANCYGVYFPAQTLPSIQDPTQAPEVEITLKRTNSNGAITVPIELKGDSVFSLGQAQFADGQDETTAVLSFPSAQDGTQYTAELMITDPAYASKYNDNKIALKYKVMRVSWLYLGVENGKAVAVSDPAKAAKITWEQGWWDEVHTGILKFYEVNGMRTCFTVSDTTADGAEGFWGTGTEIEFKWNPATNAIYYEPQFVFTHSSYNADVYMYDEYGKYNYLSGDAGSWSGPEEYFQDWPDDPCSYFENGDFNMYVAYYYMPGIGGWSQNKYDVVGYADGFIRVDYSLDVTADLTEDGVLPVYFEAGADVAAIKYAVFEGNLSDSQAEKNAAAIASGAIESEDVDMETLAAGITLEKTGVYSILAVAFDAAGNAQNSAVISATYVAASDAEEMEVALVAGLELTSPRYGKDDLNTENAIEWYVYGKDITAAKIVLVESKEYSEKLFAKASSVSADDLDMINNDILAGIAPAKAGTEYTLAVWATNGYAESITTATLTTEGDAETWKSLGMGLYTDDFMAGLFGFDPPTYEVEVQESEDNAGKYRLVNPYGEAFPYNDPGDWDDSKDYYMIIDATDPENVTIPEFEPGLKWGYDLVFMSMNAYNPAAPGGVLENGVITFAEKGLLSGVNGSLYYANTNTAFELVLPGAESASACTAKAKVSKKIGNAKPFAEIKPVVREAKAASFKSTSIEKKVSNRFSAPVASKIVR